MHYVYFIKSGPYVKIGHSRDVEKRISQMQTGSAMGLKLLGTLICESRQEAERIEAAIHRRLERYHTRGEWFKMMGLRQLLRKELRWSGVTIKEEDLNFNKEKPKTKGTPRCMRCGKKFYTEDAARQLINKHRGLESFYWCEDAMGFHLSKKAPNGKFRRS